MTREQLIDAMTMTSSICANVSQEDCPKDCGWCAEKQINEYEAQIRVATIEELKTQFLESHKVAFAIEDIWTILGKAKEQK